MHPVRDSLMHLVRETGMNNEQWKYLKSGRREIQFQQGIDIDKSFQKAPVKLWTAPWSVFDNTTQCISSSLMCF